VSTTLTQHHVVILVTLHREAWGPALWFGLWLTQGIAHPAHDVGLISLYILNPQLNPSEEAYQQRAQTLRSKDTNDISLREKPRAKELYSTLYEEAAHLRHPHPEKNPINQQLAVNSKTKSHKAIMEGEVSDKPATNCTYISYQHLLKGWYMT
jgi:hypothetical protein